MPLGIQPAPGRVERLDVVRAVALLGVLVVNAVTELRVSLFDWEANFHVGPRSPVSDVVDLALAAFVEMKAYTVFSVLFGVGLAVQLEHRGEDFRRFMARRLLALLGIGLIHLVFIWNADILVEYAVAGALVTPLLALRERALAGAGLALLVVSALPLPSLGVFPGPQHVTASLVAIGQGSWGDALAFRVDELRFLWPLHLHLLPRTCGLLVIGAWTWRVRLWTGRHDRALVHVAAAGLLIGVTASVFGVARATTGSPPGSALEALSILASAAGYVSITLLVAFRLSWLAPLGRMALTSYLTQSLVLTFVFSGWGLGFYYRVGSAATFAFSLILYAGQVVLSSAWLRMFNFGPVEWLWRCASYGRWLPMRR